MKKVYEIDISSSNYYYPVPISKFVTESQRDLITICFNSYHNIVPLGAISVLDYIGSTCMRSRTYELPHPIKEQKRFLSILEALGFDKRVIFEARLLPELFYRESIFDEPRFRACYKPVQWQRAEFTRVRLY